jgi:FkbM family methyltransferase
MFYSQILQDSWVAAHLDGLDFRQGYYVDVGCHDGHELSNTLYFAERGMMGVCIDANKESLKKAMQTRDGHFVHACVTDKNQTVGFKVSDKNVMLSHRCDDNPTYTVQGITLERILDSVAAPKDITYMSIDTEGHEYEALLGLGDYTPHILTIEHNSESEKASKVLDWLWSRNYLVRSFKWDFFAIKDAVRIEQ